MQPTNTYLVQELIYIILALQPLHTEPKEKNTMFYKLFYNLLIDLVTLRKYLKCLHILLIKKYKRR